ncbi:hypothetical protein [Alloactinosynnema sp. L-07]|uniref:hypothetical protein n=1 Tax=Alloactinosynnema sp. L-07 TaxID=1653480 RepID=UPI00065EFB67|nr:hypothetical protein [Alloactinosynnema sp. L-07]CRK60577.1 hypothetical protein [Alloactinosynnema sp. L-07]
MTAIRSGTYAVFRGETRAGHYSPRADFIYAGDNSGWARRHPIRYRERHTDLLHPSRTGSPW